MHDIIGNAGMLRGWVAVWTMQMLWLFVSLTIAVGAIAIAESLIGEFRRRREAKVKSLAPVLMKGYPGSPAA